MKFKRSGISGLGATSSFSLAKLACAEKCTGWSITVNTLMVTVSLFPNRKHPEKVMSEMLWSATHLIQLITRSSFFSPLFEKKISLFSLWVFLFREKSFFSGLSWTFLEIASFPFFPIEISTSEKNHFGKKYMV